MTPAVTAMRCFRGKIKLATDHRVNIMYKIIQFLFILLVSEHAFADNLTFQFIGNMAFSITDGNVTLYSDFPYESGAFGYMKYDLKSLKISGDGLCLITHAHRDHWANELFQPLKLKVIGPPEVLKGLNNSRIIPFAKEIQYQGIHIEPFATPHANIGHYSYLVTWHGTRMYFTGDTEELKTLLSMKNLDVAFISPWLASSLSTNKQTVDAKKIVIYHHQDGEKVVTQSNSIVPKQGEIFEIPFRESNTPAR
jgi:L-ascorbate metabolism protein UlaG (beta-lactamase superfamily)